MVTVGNGRTLDEVLKGGFVAGLVVRCEDSQPALA